MIWTILISFLITPIIWILFKYINCIMQLKNYPPGPFPLPIIGNMHMVRAKPTEALRDLAKIYGDVFSLSFGSNRAVVVNHIEPAREALITKSAKFAGRPNKIHTLKLFSRNYSGIVMADFGQMWKIMRKLSHSALKMYGDGIGNIERKVIKESDELHSRIRVNKGKPIDLQHELGLAIMNVICSMVFGHRYEVDDPEFQEFLNMNRLFVEGSMPGNPVAFMPWLRFIPIFKVYESLKEAVKIRDVLISKKLAEHLSTYDPDDIRDFTDSLIRCSRDPETLKNTDIKAITADHLEMVIFDIFIAGAETTYTTLKWSILCLLHYPRYQDLLYDQIIEVVGTERYPDLKDRSSLPLVQAAIQEVLRVSSIVALNLPHKALEDATIGGKNIPKDTLIYFNLWNMHHDEQIWENPEEFNPYRWLDEENKYSPGKHKSFLPFSAGRRSCLGETLAKTELFLFLSRLVRDFKFEPNMEEPFPSMERTYSVICPPLPFTVMLTPRDV